MSKIINLQSGGAVIAPWDVEQLPDEWLDIYLGLNSDLPEMQQAQDKVKAHYEQFRQRHPTYRKH